MEEKDYIIFIDQVGRTILGVKTHTNTTSITRVENPVMIAVQQQQNGQMAVQLFPLFFQEFVVPNKDSKARHNYFEYNNDNITKGVDFDIDERIISQYEKIVNPVLVDNAPNQQLINEGEETPDNVINLFDEKE